MSDLTKVLLDKTLVDQLIFAMEDQGKKYILLRSHSRVEVQGKNHQSPQSIPLPEWTSADGFRMRAAFIQSLSNPLAREELLVIQESGHGVFRKFKEYLRSVPTLYKKWLYFKRRFMEALIFQWAQEWEAYIQVMDLGEPEEDLDELVEQDFLFSAQKDAFLPKEIWRKLSPALPPWVPQAPLRERGYLGICSTPQEKAVGWIFTQGYESGALVWLWYVEKEYRDLGIGKTLLHQMEKYSLAQGYSKIIFPDWVGGWGEIKEAAQEGYFPITAVFEKKLQS